MIDDLELARLMRIRHLLETRREAEDLVDSFPAFVRAAWHLVEGNRPLLWNWHIDVIGDYLLAFRRREISRLVINIPVRSMKSLLCSVMFPPWVWTSDPDHVFLTLSHSEDLAERDSVRSRNIISSNWYKERFPAVQLAGDMNLKSRYSNTLGGQRLAMGWQSSGTGEGGDTRIYDDPHDAQKVRSDVERRKTINTYKEKWSTRANDPLSGGELLVMQRLHKGDMTGHALESDLGWEHLCLPMEYEGPRYTPGWSGGIEDPRQKDGELLWSERFPQRVVDAWTEDLGTYGASGQLQQRPTPPGGGIIRTQMWRPWPKGQELPEVDFVVQSFDTAYTEEEIEDASYSARTTWGVWRNPKTMHWDLMLLEAWKDRVDYSDLRKQALIAYREWQPDKVIVEKKASGISLIQDLRRAGIHPYRYRPDVDKVARAYASQPFFERGGVWYPEGRKWAKRVIDECADFPKGDHDDYVDTVTQVVIWMQKSWRVEVEGLDAAFDPDADMEKQERRKAAYG